MAFDIKRMYKQARGFQIAAERCLEVREDSEQKYLPIQAIVNYALACEIYLKAIAVFEHPERKNFKGHSFDKLYMQISDIHQSKIISFLKDVYTEDEIKSYISKFKDIFEEYRYIYELNSDDRTGWSFIYHFACALQDIVGNITIQSVLQMAGLEGTL